MESLLRWGIANSTPETAAAHPPRPIGELDPAIIDHILGKPDAVRMKEALAVAVDDSKDEDDRVTALDEFEMLVESIDNANDLSKLDMWRPLIALANSPSNAISMNAIWILGTAIQNNPKAQSDFLTYDPFPGLIALLSPSSSSSSQTRSKAVYCISGALKHSRRAVEAFGNAGGWQSLKNALNDSDITVRRKAAFLLNTLLVQDGPEPKSAGLTVFPSDINSTTASHPAPSPSDASADSHFTSGLARKALQENGIVSNLIDSIVSPLPSGPDGDVDIRDADYDEKAVRALVTYAELQKEVPWKGNENSMKELVKLGDEKTASGEKDAGPWDLTSTEWKTFKDTTLQL